MTGLWGSLFKSRITNSAEIVERPPFPQIYAHRTGRNGCHHDEEVLVGLPRDEFQGHTAVP